MINISQAFHRTSANPVDESMALTKTQMLAVNDNLMPDYYFTICQDDGEIYLYDKTATPSPTTGKFTKFEGGGSGSGVPVGGTTGQALVKKSNTDGDVEWKDPSNSMLEIHFANDAVDVGYSQLGEALAANKILKLIDTVNDVVLAFTGYYSGTYYFSTICLNRRQEMVNTSIILYHQAMGSDVVATQVQRLTLTEDVQKMEMPTADSSYLNKIYQYIGTTDANFTNGLFYRCVQNGSTYSWQECETQHRLTASEMADIMSTLPGAPTQRPKYSTTEQVVGEWIDGKPVYQKTISFGALPNAIEKRVAHGVSNISKVIHIFGIYNWASEWGSFDYSPHDAETLGYGLSFGVDLTDIVVRPKLDMSSVTESYVTIQYTKTTD